MLTAEKNKMLTQVGPGTPMGELLRRYWMPIAGAAEFEIHGDQADAAARRGPGALQGSRWRLWPDRPAMSAPPRRHALRHGRGDRHPLLLSRLVDGCGRPMHRTAVRGHRQSRSALARALQSRGLSGARTGRPAVDLYGSAAGAGTAGLGGLHLAARLPRDRHRRSAVQLVPVPGKFRRPGALRMDARQLGRPSARRQRVQGRPPSETEIR